ncbi:MAG: hypothetical protein WD402_03155 [Chloroflexota bacterium]
MSFLSKGRRGKESEEPPTDEPTATQLAVVEFWAAGQRTLAGMDLSQGRLTDLINRQDILPVVLLDERPEDLSQPIEKRADQQWTHFLIWDALLIVPPPRATDPSRRLHRPKQPVELVIGPFVVSGMVHIPPGAQAAGFLLRQNLRFAPLTRAVVQDSGREGFEQRAEVILVNMRRVETMRDIGVEEPEGPSS